LRPALAKAAALEMARILVPRGIRLPFPLSRSSAGPGGGTTSIFLQIGETTVRLEVERDADRDRRTGLALRGSGGRLDIIRGGRVLARDVRVRGAGLHAPGQAFINLHDRCRFGCAFCNLPVSPGKGLPARRWAAIVRGALAAGKVDAVAVTTGIPDTPSRACRDIARLVRSVRRDFPSVPVGVEPYTVDEGDLRALRRAGATELKLNIQCATGAIMRRVCPELDRDGILENLEAGVRLFGRGRVCSNLIIGLGETDAQALRAARLLARMGVAVNIRPLRVNALNRGPLERALGGRPGPPDGRRLLRLSRAQKRIFLEHGLEPGSFRTMCHRCTACDIEPFADL